MGGGETKGGGGPDEGEKDHNFFPKQGFVFGKSEAQKKKGPEKESGESSTLKRRPVPTSYRDKLLSPGLGGFLVRHDEEEDIVNGWRGYFNKKNMDEQNKEDTIASDEEDMSDMANDGKTPRLQMTAEEYTEWCRPWLNSLIIKVLGADIPKRILIDRISRMWRPRDPLKIIALNNGYSIVSFTTREDRDYAFQEGPWMINDHYLIVQRWRPNFHPWKADLQRKIAAWIRIPDLPMELYNVESLRRIGNMVGKTIKIDRSTSIYDKGGFARICVEVDLHQPLLPEFEAFGEKRSIIYEGLHLVCFKCGRYGHQKENCHYEYHGMDEKEDTMNVEADVNPKGNIVSEDSETHKSRHESPEMSGVNVTPPPKPEYGNIQILKRDFRRKNAVSEIMGDDKKITKNQEGGSGKGISRGIEKIMGKIKVNEGKALKANNDNNKGWSYESNKKLAEWVPVGSKRKNVVKVVPRRKESHPPAREKIKKKELLGLNNEPISYNNPFAVLQSIPMDPQNLSHELNTPSCSTSEFKAPQVAGVQQSACKELMTSSKNYTGVIIEENSALMETQSGMTQDIMMEVTEDNPRDVDDSRITEIVSS